MLRYRKNQILSYLIQTAYLPTEMPPAVTARAFSLFAKENYNSLKTYKPNVPTQFEKFSIPRENGARRDLAIVHPAAQLRISLLITENHRRIREIISSSKMSLYSVDVDKANYKAFKGVDFRDLDKKRSAIARHKAYILNADISRFFYTIYTHSIPWAVVGKEKAKESVRSRNKKTVKSTHWTDCIDSALQFCQSRETFGIPVGPDTSRIIAEILLSGVHSDEDFLSVFGGGQGFRLVDDFFVGFDTEAKCLDALISLRNVLAKFNLQLNDEKTWIKPAREIFMDRWRHELLHIAIPPGDIRRQARGIHRLAEASLYHASKLGHGFPVKWAAQKLSKIHFQRKNFGLLLSTLLRLSRDFPVCMNSVVAFVINNKILCSQPTVIEYIRGWVKAIFHNHARNSHDFEVAWALVVCGALKIKVSKTDFGDYTASVCSVAFAILGLLQMKGLLSEPLSNFGWKAEVKKAGVDGNHWLMFYESVLRGWTRDKSMIGAVKSHSLMKTLLENKISFLDDSIFGSVNINLEKRLIRRFPAVLISGGDLKNEDNFEESSLGLASL